MKYSGYMLNGRRWIPSLALLSASIGFGYLGSVLYTAQTRGGSSPFGPAANFNHAASIELILIGLLYVLLYERKENFGNLGLGFGRKDWIQTLYLLSGLIGLFLVYALAVSIYVFFFHGTDAGSSRSTDQTMNLLYTAILQYPFPYLVLYLLINAAFEELIIRVFLMTELNAWLHKAGLTVLASALIQTGYHLYQGSVRCIPLFFLFLIFSVYYQKFKRATPLIAAHFLVDLFGVSALLLLARFYPGYH